MPDENKFKALNDAEFKILPTCSTCNFFRVKNVSGWGYCSAIHYDHTKHTGKRELGVPGNGHCFNYKLCRQKLEDWTQSYSIFYEI